MESDQVKADTLTAALKMLWMTKHLAGKADMSTSFLACLTGAAGGVVVVVLVVELVAEVLLLAELVLLETTVELLAGATGMVVVLLLAGAAGVVVVLLLAGAAGVVVVLLLAGAVVLVALVVLAGGVGLVVFVVVVVLFLLPSISDIILPMIPPILPRLIEPDSLSALPLIFCESTFGNRQKAKIASARTVLFI